MTHEPFSKRPLPIACASVAIAVAGNLTLSLIFPLTLHTPLFMDSIMTVAVTFFAGLVPGLLSGLVYNALWPFLVGGDPRQVLFGLCSMATALVAFLYMRGRGKKEWILLDLMILAILTGFVNSALGGIISTFAFRGFDHFPSDYVMAGMLMEDIPLAGAAILARIPLNLIDKGLAVFLGYGAFILADSRVGRKADLR